MIPIENETYNCFDDGKISYSRMYSVKVSEVIPFDIADNNIINMWLSKKADYPWLFAKSTDFFISTIEGENGECGIFARTVCGGWFGLGDWYNSGRLDVDGSLLRILESDDF